MAVTPKEWSVVMKRSRGTDALVGTAASYFDDHIYDAVSVRTLQIHGASIQKNCEVMKQSKAKDAMAGIALYFADKIYQTVP